MRSHAVQIYHWRINPSNVWKQASPRSAGWLAGWAARSETNTVFALNLDIRAPRHIAERMNISQACLAAIGAI